jgi:hypothetical protein
VLEILILVVLCRRIGGIVAAKGRKKLGYQLMLVAFWVGGEISGLIAGFIVQAISSGGRETGPVVPFVCALIGASLGAFVAFTIARSLAPLQLEFAEEYDQPWPDEADARWSGRPAAAPGGTRITDRARDSSPRPDDRIRE